MFSIFLLLGGIGMFLYGIDVMSKGLQRLASGKFRSILEKATGNGFMAVLTGVVLTVLIQSSGASSIMAISFVGSGLLSLLQSLYIMLGANIGTTVTAQIIAFDIEVIAPLIFFIGVILTNFIKNDAVKRVGVIVLGFGLLFTGIYIMGDAISELDLLSVISGFLGTYSNPALHLLFGVVFTALIQSSSASVGMLQVLAMRAAVGTVSLDSFVYMIIGMNIGACAPTVLASFSGSRDSRRAAVGSLILKALGAGIFIAVFLIFPGVTDLVKRLSPSDIARQIANFHLLFNLIASLVLCPVTPMISRVLMRIIPEKGEEKAPGPIFISSDLLIGPSSVAVARAHEETVHMYEQAYANMEMAIHAFFHPSEDEIKQVLADENTIDIVCNELSKFLIPLSTKQLTSRESTQVSIMLQIITDIERISDHAENIVQFRQTVDEEGLTFSEAGTGEMRAIALQSLKTLDASLNYLRTGDASDVNRVMRSEDMVNNMQAEFMDNHVTRLQRTACAPRSGVIFTDMLSDLERCADEAVRITQVIQTAGA